jgi:hypothetical protein
MPKGTCRCTEGCMNCWNDCANFGECIRGKSVRVVYAASAAGRDATREKQWDRELQSYRDARAQGIQPASTKTDDIRKAVDLSNKAGAAFDASTNSFVKGS